MLRSVFVPSALLSIVISLAALPAEAGPRNTIISETQAARHGLARPWIAQLQVDRSRARLRYLALYEGALYAQSDRAMVHAIDAETGQTLWARQIGRPDHPSLQPGVNDDLLAVVNGSRLYVVNRYNGDLLLERELPGAPGAGPALSRRRAYVPMLNGMMVAFPVEPLTDPLRELGRLPAGLTEDELEELRAERREDIRVNQEAGPPLSARAYGRTAVQPLVTTQSDVEEYVTWPTERGYLYTGSIDPRNPQGLNLNYRLPTQGPIESRAAYLPPDPRITGATGTIFTASRDGYVYALVEKTGRTVWRYSCGEAIIEQPALVFPRLFVTTQLGGMYSLDARTGEQQWWVPHVRQFVAASETRVYAFDMADRLLVLDIESGARLDSVFTGPLPVRLSNDQTDRIYLASETGFIQCLHELELSEPLRHNQIVPERREIVQEALQEEVPERRDEVRPDVPGDDPFAVPPARPAAPADDPFAAPPARPAAPADDPFGAPRQQPAPQADDPFGAPQQQPAPQDDDPFGGRADADPFGGDPFGGN